MYKNEHPIPTWNASKEFWYLNNSEVSSIIDLCDNPNTINPIIESITLNETLNENELKLGQALYEIFQNYDDIFIGNSNNKFNKNIILFELREMTNLSTKEIRTMIKKYKKLYFDLVQEILKK